MWLDHQILNWNSFSDGGAIQNEKLALRAYEIWSHAEKLLNKSLSELDRVDVVTSIKRAIDHRVRLLDKLYNFRKIPIKDKPSDLLGLLEFSGLLRPIMLKKLIDIRNSVEHEDSSPPNTETCQVYLEFAWYFLRSTDPHTRLVRNPFTLTMDDGDEDYWAAFDLSPGENWLPKIRGWFPQEMVSNQPIDSWLSLKVRRTETRRDLLERESLPHDVDEDGRGKESVDVFVDAEIRGPSNGLAQLIRLYFKVI